MVGVPYEVADLGDPTVGKEDLSGGRVLFRELLDIGLERLVKLLVKREPVLGQINGGPWSTCEKLMVPNRETAVAQVSTTEGMHAGRYPSPGMRSIPFSRHQSMVKALGDQPMPLMANALPSFAE